MPTETPLLCPTCKSPRLRSDEKATIGYPVRLARLPDGQVDVTYTGDDREVFDEGTVYDGRDLWCRDCGANFTEDDLVEAAAGEDDD